MIGTTVDQLIFSITQFVNPRGFSLRRRREPLMRNAPGSCSFRRLPPYDLEGYKPYRTSLTEQYRRMGSLLGLQYGAPKEPKLVALSPPSPSPSSALGEISGKSLMNGPSRK